MLQAAKRISRREPEAGDFPPVPLRWRWEPHGREGAHAERGPWGDSRAEGFDLGLNTLLIQIQRA